LEQVPLRSCSSNSCIFSIFSSDETSECLEERRQALGRLGVPSIGRHAPECDTNGNYRTVQTNGNSDFRWCVNPAGYPVRGTQRWGETNCTLEVMSRIRTSEKGSMLSRPCLHRSKILAEFQGSRSLVFSADLRSRSLDFFAMFRNLKYLGLAI